MFVNVCVCVPVCVCGFTPVDICVCVCVPLLRWRAISVKRKSFNKTKTYSEMSIFWPFCLMNRVSSPSTHPGVPHPHITTPLSNNHFQTEEMQLEPVTWKKKKNIMLS